MGITRRSADPAGITNASGEPEITLEVEGLTLSAMPPKAPKAKVAGPTPPDEPDRGATL
jgi:hypothetical protein